MNQIPNIEETYNTREGIEEILAKKLHALETDWSDGCYIRGEDVDAICDYVHQELQKAREEVYKEVQANAEQCYRDNRRGAFEPVRAVPLYKLFTN